jgi:hypothetical protein
MFSHQADSGKRQSQIKILSPASLSIVATNCSPGIQTKRRSHEACRHAATLPIDSRGSSAGATDAKRSEFPSSLPEAGAFLPARANHQVFRSACHRPRREEIVTSNRVCVRPESPRGNRFRHRHLPVRTTAQPFTTAQRKGTLHPDDKSLRRRCAVA